MCGEEALRTYITDQLGQSRGPSLLPQFRASVELGWWGEQVMMGLQIPDRSKWGKNSN